MERKIVKDVSKDPPVTAKDIINDIKTAKFNVSTKAVPRCSHWAGLRACRPRKTHLLKIEHLISRLTYARRHLDHERERERETERQRKRERECVCVCVWERERERERERKKVCVWEREREKERECVCVWERERERERVDKLRFMVRWD